MERVRAAKAQKSDTACAVAQWFNLVDVCYGGTSVGGVETMEHSVVSFITSVTSHVVFSCCAFRKAVCVMAPVQCCATSSGDVFRNASSSSAQ